MAKNLSVPDAERDAELLDPQRFLCHYTRAEIAFSHILPSGRLRMNPYLLMRDPFESRHPHFWVPRGIHGDADHNLHVDVVNEIGFRRGRYRLLSLTRGDERTGTAREVPFRCPWGRPRMWEQYADNHAGACLVFHRTAILDAICGELADDYWHGRVDYTTAGFSTSRAVELDLDIFRDDVTAASTRHIDMHHRDLFFLKTDDWASEYEYRVVYRAVTDASQWTPPPHDVRYGDSLRYVLLNVDRFPAWQLLGAVRAIEQAGAKYRTMAWDAGQPSPGFHMGWSQE
jgi:Protein of unknown function (DUF2971)